MSFIFYNYLVKSILQIIKNIMFKDIIFTMPYYCHCVGLEIGASLYHQNRVTNNNNVLSHFGKSGFTNSRQKSPLRFGYVHGKCHTALAS